MSFKNDLNQAILTAIVDLAACWPEKPRFNRVRPVFGGAKLKLKKQIIEQKPV